MLPSLFSPYTRRHPARKRLTGANHSPHRLHIEQLENRTLLSGTPWVEEAKLTASDAAAGDRFGISVSISGDTVVVGAGFDDDRSGSAYVFIEPATGWEDATEDAKLTASDAVAGDWFGVSVSISGDTVVVGAGFDDDWAGSAYVFIEPATGWEDAIEDAKLTASDAVAGDWFGYWGISISGDTIVVGASGDDDQSGSAYVFQGNGITWTEQVKLTASDTEAGDFFGESVSISGDTIVVGAEGDDDNGSRSGSAYVFVRRGSTWTEQVKLTASDAAAGDFFGWPVSISGNTIVVGAGGNDDAGSTSGSGFIFTLVVNPIAAINDLTNIVFEMELSQGMKNALQSKLDLPLRALTDDNLQNDVSAINSLQAFINAVEAQREKKISEADADNLTAAALATIGLLEEEMEI